MNPRTRHLTILLASMLTTLVAIVAGRIVFGLVMPAMLAALGLDYARGSQLGAACALGYLAGIAPAGAFASRRGDKPAVVLGLALSAATHGALAASSAFALLMALMFALGVATALTFTPLLSLVGGVFTQRRGTALSVAASGIGIGMLAAGAWVPVAVQTSVDGWRLVWVAMAALALLALMAVQLALPAPPPLVPSAPAGRAASSIGLAGYAAVWRDTGLRGTAVLYAVLGVAFTVNNLFNYGYAVERGLSAAHAGALVGAAGVISILAGPALGYLSDRVDRAHLLHAAYLVSAFVTAWIALWPTAIAFTVYFTVLGLVTLGIPALILAQASTQALGTHLPVSLATSFVTLAFAVGQFLAPAVIGLAPVGASGLLRWVFMAQSALLALAVVPGVMAGRSAARRAAAGLHAR